MADSEYYSDSDSQQGEYIITQGVDAAAVPQLLSHTLSPGLGIQSPVSMFGSSSMMQSPQSQLQVAPPAVSPFAATGPPPAMPQYLDVSNLGLNPAAMPTSVPVPAPAPVTAPAAAVAAAVAPGLGLDLSALGLGGGALLDLGVVGVAATATAAAPPAADDEEDTKL